MITPAHHPGAAGWGVSGVCVCVGGGGQRVTVNSYVSPPITASGTDKSILAAVMKKTLMHGHN